MIMSRATSFVAGGLCAALLAGPACGDDPATAISDANDTHLDTSDDGDTAGTDTASDTSDTTVADASDTANDATVADTSDTANDTTVADTSDTASDTTVADTTNDTITPSPLRPALVAWTGRSLTGPAFGSLTGYVVNDGTFEPHKLFLGGLPERPIIFGDTANLGADVDGDGLMDLIAWSGFSTNSPFRGSLDVYRATGSGYDGHAIWTPPGEQVVIPRGTTANLAGDVDGDGKADLVAWTGYADNGPARGVVQVLLSTGRAFAASTPWFSGSDPAPVQRGTTANLLGDVDGDGKADLVAWSGFADGPFRGAVHVHLSTGAAFAPATTWLTGTNEAPVTRAEAHLLADVDGDGRADLIAVSPFSPGGPYRGAIQVHLSTGTGFAPLTTWYSGTNDHPVVTGGAATLATDLNGDGKADLVAWTGYAPPNAWGGLVVSLSNGRGFDAPTVWAGGSPEAPVMAGETANLGGRVIGN